MFTENFCSAWEDGKELKRRARLAASKLIEKCNSGRDVTTPNRKRNQACLCSEQKNQSRHPQVKNDAGRGWLGVLLENISPAGLVIEIHCLVRCYREAWGALQLVRKKESRAV